MMAQTHTHDDEEVFHHHDMPTDKRVQGKKLFGQQIPLMQGGAINFNFTFSHGDNENPVLKVIFFVFFVESCKNKLCNARSTVSKKIETDDKLRNTITSHAGTIMLCVRGGATWSGTSLRECIQKHLHLSASLP